mgnify:CR=1 FL=1
MLKTLLAVEGLLRAFVMQASVGLVLIVQHVLQANLKHLQVILNALIALVIVVIIQDTQTQLHKRRVLHVLPTRAAAVPQIKVHVMLGTREPRKLIIVPLVRRENSVPIHPVIIISVLCVVQDIVQPATLLPVLIKLLATSARLAIFPQMVMVLQRVLIPVASHARWVIALLLLVKLESVRLLIATCARLATAAPVILVLVGV